MFHTLGSVYTTPSVGNKQYKYTYFKLLLAFIMHSVTSFVDFKNTETNSLFQGGQMLPSPPERNPKKAL